MSQALVKAASDGDVAGLTRLLDAGADIDAEGQDWNALHAAIEQSRVACVRLLVRKGADIERAGAGLSPLAHAVDAALDGSHQTGGIPHDDAIEIIEILLNAGADRKPGLRMLEEHEGSAFAEHLTSALERRR